MEEINHFNHEEHPLKLIENWETVASVIDGAVEKKSVVDCNGCQEPISSLSGDSAYGCLSCRYFLHKTYAQLTPTIDHHLHPQHPLTLIALDDDIWSCDVCDKQSLVRGFSYNCSMCNFDACTKCSVAIALKAEALMKLKHEGHHPQHTLTLQSRSATFHCDACHTKNEDFFYQCDDCDFWIHKACTSLASIICLPHHHHLLVLVHSLPDNFYNYDYFCEFCDKYILQNVWIYHCANCRYFAHIKCALNAELSSRDGPVGTSPVDEEDVNDLLHFPMSYTFTDPLKLLHSENKNQDYYEKTTEINHWSHDHPLILNGFSQGNNIDPGADPIEVCYGCVRPLSFPYYSCSEDGCSFSLHKYCAQLPLTLEKYQLHPDHQLHLQAVTSESLWKCDGCYSLGNTFSYKCHTCEFILDVNCTFIPNTIKHELHKHPLIQVINHPKPICSACNKRYNGISYACKVCSFQLDMYCATRSPRSLGHRYCKGHGILLTYPPVEDHPEDFYCDICEEELHPKRPLYYCQQCKNSFHLYCLSGKDDFENIWREGTKIESYHKHPLTFVRRRKTPEYVCSKCNVDVNGRLILECRAKTCNFNICNKCYLKTLDS